MQHLSNNRTLLGRIILLAGVLASLLSIVGRPTADAARTRGRPMTTSRTNVQLQATMSQGTFTATGVHCTTAICGGLIAIAIQPTGVANENKECEDCVFWVILRHIRPQNGDYIQSELYLDGSRIQKVQFRSYADGSQPLTFTFGNVHASLTHKYMVKMLVTVGHSSQPILVTGVLPASR